MPYSDRAKHNAAQLRYRSERRAAWFAEHGPCKCGSWNKLELDHIDPKQKVDHKIWSWAENRRNVELAKCQVLCHKCHKAKSNKEISKVGPVGTAWCVGHQEFLVTSKFHRDFSRPNEYKHYCKECQRTFRDKRAPVV